MVLLTLIGLYLLSGADAFAPHLKHTKRQIQRERLFTEIAPSVDLVWHPCNETQEVQFECARLSVPLDYKRPENGLRAIIPIVKYPASKDVPYKGAVLFNPGGPGALGTETIYDLAMSSQIGKKVVGPGYDILGFDIRGTGYSVPYASCGIFPGVVEPERQNATVDLKRRAPVNLPPPDSDVYNKYGVLFHDFPPSWYNSTVEYSNMLNEECTRYTGQYHQAGPHMNTVVIATDMLSIGKALARARGEPEETTLVNYYGVSYGTVLGQYFATLYPNNVGKFVLDSVVNVDTWRTKDELETSIVHVDKIVNKFFTGCFEAGPEACAFHTGHTSGAVKRRFNLISAKFNATRYEIENDPAAWIVKFCFDQIFRSLMFQALYIADKAFAPFAQMLVDLEPVLAAENPLEWDLGAISDVIWSFAIATLPVTYSEIVQLSETFTQIACSDAYDLTGYVPSAAEIKKASEVSRFKGIDVLMTKIGCANYKIRPSWQWYGPIGAQTKTPILFVNNMLDPITPFENAVKARKLFKGAKMVYVDEIGHGIIAVRNTCVVEKVTAYFQNGALPGHDNRCKEEFSPWQH